MPGESQAKTNWALSELGLGGRKNKYLAAWSWDEMQKLSLQQATTFTFYEQVIHRDFVMNRKGFPWLWFGYKA